MNIELSTVHYRLTVTKQSWKNMRSKPAVMVLSLFHFLMAADLMMFSAAGHDFL